MKKNRHSYYEELEKNADLIFDKVWLKKAFNCVLTEHISWVIDDDNLDRIINNNYTKNEYLEFISLHSGLISENIRTIEEMNWYKVYAKFSECLNNFYNKYGENSGEQLYETYIKYNLSNKPILPWVNEFEKQNVTSIDPIHIFASFNYWKIPIYTRKERMNLFCNLMKLNDIDTNSLIEDIERYNLDVFEDFPHIDIRQIVSARKLEYQKQIWQFFSLTYQNQKDKEFEDIFNQINTNWKGVRLESATIFMFWVNSDNFIPLDKNTIALLQEHNVINKPPITFYQYQQLLKNQNTFLYRNITRVAINKGILSTLLMKEERELNLFLTQNKIKYNNIDDDFKYDKLDLDLVENFDFEFYFMIDGKVKKIIYENNEIISYTEMDLIDKPKYDAYSNFQLIAIKSLNAKYSKLLENKKIYYFNNNFKINSNSISFTNEKAISIYKTDSINNINISAIVGKNGTGKSTIIEFIIMAINNIAKSLEENDKYGIKKFEDFFYTIHTNYSLHSLNEKYYEGEWLHKLFHKNDAYQTPIVIEPYRDDGVIDVNKLDKLAKQRLLSRLLEPSNNFGGKDREVKLTENQNATHLKITVNYDKMETILRDMIVDPEKASEYIGIGFEEGLKEILSYSENINILNILVPNSLINTNLYINIAKVYICYKVNNIANTYKVYSGYKNNLDNQIFLNLLNQDKSHITFKLQQAIHFLQFNILDKIDTVEIKTISTKISEIQSEYNEIKTIELIPPSFFNIEIILDDDKSFDLLSSGEKQKIYSISSILYHLQNIESVHRGNKNHIKYKYVNLILDEIELYFHPDMQRTFISDLLTSINDYGGLNNIVGLNIILVTHSPFILSDLLESQTLYLPDNKTKEKILEKKFKNTFGSNIHTLLDDSFFMQDGLMGEYSKNAVKDIISKLNLHRIEIEKNLNKQDLSKIIDTAEQNRIKQIVSNLGEPFLKNKIFDMYFSLFDDKENQIDLLEKEQDLIEEKIRKLKYDTNKK